MEGENYDTQDSHHQLLLDVIIRAEASGCSFEPLMGTCPRLTWNQIFLAVDQLNRDGVVHT